MKPSGDQAFARGRVFVEQPAEPLDPAEGRRLVRRQLVVRRDSSALGAVAVSFVERLKRG